jgi:hypothetical protein
MILLLFKLIIITVIWVLGVKIVTSDGMLFGAIGRYADSKESLIWKPLLNCIWCMPSIHSLIGYGLAIGIGIITVFSWHLIFMYPLVAMGSSFICGVLWNVSECIDTFILFLNNKNNINHQ